MTEIKLPESEYLHIRQSGKTIVICTMRQKALHTIGLNSGHVGRRLYTRNGKRYYKPYRNYFYGNDNDLDKLVKTGYMDYIKEYEMYFFDRRGLDWLGSQIGVIIKDEEE